MVAGIFLSGRMHPPASTSAPVAADVLHSARPLATRHPSALFAAIFGVGAAVGGLALAWRATHREEFAGPNAPSAGSIADAPRDHRATRIVSFNIRAAHGPEKLGHATPEERERNLREIAQAIERLDPDVVLMQEVEQNFNRGGEFPMFARLKELLHADDAAMSERDIGAATFTRNGYSIADRRDGTNHIHSKAINHDSVLTASVVPPSGGAPFTVVNAHTSPGDLDELTDRVKAIRAGTLDRDDPFPTNVVVAGDFNERTSRVDRALGGLGVHDALKAVGVPIGAGFARETSPSANWYWPGSLPDRDHIHVTGAVRGAAILDPKYERGPWRGQPLSDHRPIVADIVTTR